MPRYHFQIVNKGKAFRAAEPLELADIEAAWEEATCAAGQLIRDLDGPLLPGDDWSITVEDECRNKLRTLAVSAKAHR